MTKKRRIVILSACSAFFGLFGIAWIIQGFGLCGETTAFNPSLFGLGVTVFALGLLF